MLFSKTIARLNGNTPTAAIPAPTTTHAVFDNISKLEIASGTIEQCRVYTSAFGGCYIQARGTT